MPSTELYFQVHPIEALNGDWNFAAMPVLAWRRRIWLKRNGQRVPRALSKRASPLA